MLRWFVCRLIEWDAVEGPSQMQEKWVYDENTLNSFAKHWQTSAYIPQDLLKRIQAMRTFRKGKDAADMSCQHGRNVYLDIRETAEHSARENFEAASRRHKQHVNTVQRSLGRDLYIKHCVTRRSGYTVGERAVSSCG